jgi:hypothetical protein
VPGNLLTAAILDRTGFLLPTSRVQRRRLRPSRSPASICSDSLRRGAHTTGDVVRESSWAHVKAHSRRGLALRTAALGVLRWQLSQLRNPRLCRVKPHARSPPATKQGSRRLRANRRGGTPRRLGGPWITPRRYCRASSRGEPNFTSWNRLASWLRQPGRHSSGRLTGVTAGPISRKLEPERGRSMAALDSSECPAVESVPGKVSGASVFKGTRTPVAVVF